MIRSYWNPTLEQKMKAMMYKKFQTVLLALATLILATACSPSKMIERGDYQGAVSLSTRKLSGKKKKKVKHVQALETAFRKATTNDLRRAKSLEKENRSENWVEINRIHRRISTRQALIEPLLPLIADNGYKADFRFVKIEDLEIESKKKAAEHFYNEGKRLLARAENGNKDAARQAFNEFESVNNYYRTYKDVDKLKEKALDLGTVYVLFKIENRSTSILHRDFERELQRVSTRDLDNRWKIVHVNAQSGRKYDYNVVMNLRQIEVTPELVHQREYTDDKIIDDGFDYVLDENGNVVQDSAGNDIKVPRKIRIEALVFETLQQKKAVVSGSLDYYDNWSRQRIHTEPITAEAIFENYAATFRGESEALSLASKQKIGNRPLPFPSDISLVLQAADRMKPLIKRKIARSRILI